MFSVVTPAAPEMVNRCHVGNGGFMVKDVILKILMISFYWALSELLELAFLLRPHCLVQLAQQGVPRWFRRLSFRLLVSAQVLISG